MRTLQCPDSYGECRKYGEDYGYGCAGIRDPNHHQDCSAHSGRTGKGRETTAETNKLSHARVVAAKCPLSTHLRTL